MEAERREFSYGAVIGDAFRISWRNKYLWWLGLLQAALGAVFGIFGAFGGLIQPTPTGGVPPFLQNNLVLIITLAIVVSVVLLVVGVFVSLVCTGGLVGAAAEIHRGRESGFGAAWRAGLSVFWRLLLQSILFILISLGLFVLPAVVCATPVVLTFLLSESVAARVFVGIIFGLLFIVLYIALLVPFSAVSQFAIRDLVLNRGGAAGAISEGYRVFRRNLGRSVALALITFGFTIAFVVISGAINFLFSLLSTGAAIGFSMAESGGGAASSSVIVQLLALIPTTLVSAATAVYFSAFWTVAYLRITAPNDPPATDGGSSQPA